MSRVRATILLAGVVAASCGDDITPMIGAGVVVAQTPGGLAAITLPEGDTEVVDATVRAQQIAIQPTKEMVAVAVSDNRVLVYDLAGANEPLVTLPSLIKPDTALRWVGDWLFYRMDLEEGVRTVAVDPRQLNGQRTLEGVAPEDLVASRDAGQVAYLQPSAADPALHNLVVERLDGSDSHVLAVEVRGRLIGFACSDEYLVSSEYAAESGQRLIARDWRGNTAVDLGAIDGGIWPIPAPPGLSLFSDACTMLTRRDYILLEVGLEGSTEDVVYTPVPHQEVNGAGFTTTGEVFMDLLVFRGDVAHSELVVLSDGSEPLAVPFRSQSCRLVEASATGTVLARRCDELDLLDRRTDAQSVSASSSVSFFGFDREEQSALLLDDSSLEVSQLVLDTWSTRLLTSLSSDNPIADYAP